VLTAVFLGFVLGLRHALDPDHLVAVSTILARRRSPWTASWVGASWGLGHTATIFAVGFAIVALRAAIPEPVVVSFELCVGAMLVGLGGANLLAAARARAGIRADDGAGLPLRGALVRSGLVGLVHGLAGSAAVSLAAVGAMPTTAMALAYLVVFGLGTVAGMMACSLVLAAPLRHLPGVAGRRRALTAGTGLASLSFGVWWIWAVGAGGATALFS